MGISGLLTVLKSIQKHTHLRCFAGQTIGVDAYGWLHRGTVACAMELALDRPCKKHVDYAMHRVRMLLYFGVTPYLVFDGDNLPGKADTETARAKRREDSKRRGLELYKARKLSQAYPEFQKAVDVTPHMARQLIEELKKLDIKYVVAPYEADAQLAYLEKKGIIDGILSEDSDLLVYGAMRLITKLDQHGDCIEINRSDFASCRDMTLAGFTDADFRCMAILSGCDYLASINKVGLKTAHTYVRKYKQAEKILRMFQSEQKFFVPNGYLERFYEAERTFLHHRVFCPLERKLVFLTNLADDMREEDMPYLGMYVSPATAIGVACGDLDPMTKEPISAPTRGSSSSTPDLYRRQTLASTHDLKPSKSVDNFLRPRRQPLAELDPNSLTPSPSQQRLLNLHRNASWEARPVSSAPQLRRSTSSLPDPGHPQLGQTQSRETLLFLEKAATLSTFQPTKRTRLCSDTNISPSGKEFRSPFFTAKPELSPTITKRCKTKKPRHSDKGLFSDNAITDVFRDIQEPQAASADSSSPPIDLPNMDKRSRSRECSAIDPPASHNCDTPIPQTTPMAESAVSQTSSGISVSGSSTPGDFEDLVEMHVNHLNKLRQTFAYQPVEKQPAALRSLSAATDAHQPTQKEDRRGEKQLGQGGTPRPSPEVSRQFHSQRTASLQKTFSVQSSGKQAAALKSLGGTQSSTQKVKLALAALDPITSPKTQQRPLTPLQQLGQQALHKSRAPNNYPRRPSSGPLPMAETEHRVNKILKAGVQGSEDLLVPDSEDEGSESSEMGNSNLVAGRIDLTRFAFTANV